MQSLFWFVVVAVVVVVVVVVVVSGGDSGGGIFGVCLVGWLVFVFWRQGLGELGFLWFFVCLFVCLF